MTRVPSVSILLPLRDAAPFLPAALASLRAQDIPELEVIVSDGGSTDGTLEVLAAHAGGLSVRVLPESDRGQSHGLNRAFAAARGEVIGWLNGDDEYAPGALRCLLDALTGDPRRLLAYGDHEHIDEHGRRLERYPALPPWAWVMRHEGFVLNAQSALWRRTLHDRIGGFDECLHRTMDYDLLLRMLDGLSRREIVRVPGVVGRFRRHPAQKTWPGAGSAVREEHRQIQDKLGRRSARDHRHLLPLWLAARGVRAWTYLRREGVLRLLHEVCSRPSVIPRHLREDRRRRDTAGTQPSRDA
jgi:glycosyltransferase involved in cell wall biosynthesis